jgi:hypothetical protein
MMATMATFRDFLVSKPFEETEYDQRVNALTEFLMENAADFENATLLERISILKTLYTETSDRTELKDHAKYAVDQLLSKMQLQESKMRLQHSDAQLAQYDQDNRNVVATTIQYTYTETDSSGIVHSKKPPPLLFNSLVTPSLSDHGRKGQTILPAGIQNIEYEENTEENTSMWISPDRVTVPIRDGNKSFLVSLLGGQLSAHRDDTLTYLNEIDIQLFVRHMVVDAITALGLKEVLNNHVEVALYGIIPDVIVVRVYGRVVFFVEVKSPDGPDKTTVFTSEPVAGQVYSYLMAMLQHGNERPTGALMTYEKMCLVSLIDMKEDAARKTLVKEVSIKLKTDFRDTVTMAGFPKPCNPDSPHVSPSRTQQELKNLVRPYLVKTPAETEHKKKRKQDSEQDQDLEQIVFYSRIYKGSEIFPALLQALQLAYDDSEKMQIEEHLSVARHDDPLGHRLFLKGNNVFTKFVVTAAPLKADAKQFPQKNSKVFYLLAHLGAGKSGTTYLACNTSGKLCAVKMYIPKRSVAATAPERESEWQVRYTEKETKRDEELLRWKSLSESKCAFGVKLCGNPCLVMPYGIEIPSGDRPGVLDKIKDRLTEFAEKGFSYEELRWRHVLRDYEGHLFLADLESLIFNEEKRTRQWVASVVTKQVELLRESAIVLTTTPLEAAASAPADAAAIPRVELAATHKRKR